MASWTRQMILRIKRRKTRVDKALYFAAKAGSSVSLPVLPAFHSFLYHEWTLRCSAWHNFWRVLYYEPMFKSQCKSVGKGFRMEYAGNGSAKVRGNLSLSLADNVHMFDNTVFIGLKVCDAPEMVVGSNTYLGPQVHFMVGKKITVGSYCLITCRMITDNPGHPVEDVLERMQSAGGSPSAGSMRPIIIGDFCFLPIETVVYPGVTVGDGVVARIGTHISRDVPPFCQVAGNPMRILRLLPIPEELRGVVGEERYNNYLKEHDKIVL